MPMRLNVRFISDFNMSGQIVHYFLFTQWCAFAILCHCIGWLATSDDTADFPFVRLVVILCVVSTPLCHMPNANDILFV